MAFDGILVHALANELNQALSDGHIQKIAQPEPEELLLSVKTPAGLFRVLMAANASLPLVYLSDDNKPSPLSAPNFCMLLRKHIGSARIIAVTQPGLERVLDIKLEHLDELGDLCEKHLMVELMGKYSNIIFTDGENRILDAIRHVPPTVSSVRTVLPGYNYFIPETQGKKDSMTETRESFLSTINDNETLSEAVCRHYNGFSTQAVAEFLFANGFRDDLRVSELTDKGVFADALFRYFDEIRSNSFAPSIAYETGENDILRPVSFSAMALPSYAAQPGKYTVKTFDSPSLLLREYYKEKNLQNNMKQRSYDLRKAVQNLLERAVKKASLQEKQLKDAETREQNRLFGELLTAYAYKLPVGEKSVEAENYYTNETVVIPTDPDLSIADNAKKYYEKYTKQKRTFQAVSEQLVSTREDIDYLQSVLCSIDLSTEEQDLSEIRAELSEGGYLKRSTKKGASRQKTKPYHYVSSDGFDIYIGRNNTQNDTLTFRFAENQDYFFHVKKMPGSHVILQTGGREVPDRAYEEAAALAVYYSSARESGSAEVDYVRKKEVKKPAKAKPGFVVYYTNYSMVARADISGLRRLA